MVLTLPIQAAIRLGQKKNVYLVKMSRLTALLILDFTGFKLINLFSILIHSEPAVHAEEMSKEKGQKVIANLLHISTGLINTGINI